MDSHERCMGSNGISRLACGPCYENVHLEERVRLPKCLSKRSFIYVLVFPFLLSQSLMKRVLCTI